MYAVQMRQVNDPVGASTLTLNTLDVSLGETDQSNATPPPRAGLSDRGWQFEGIARPVPPEEAQAWARPCSANPADDPPRENPRTQQNCVCVWNFRGAIASGVLSVITSVVDPYVSAPDACMSDATNSTSIPCSSEQASMQGWDLLLSVAKTGFAALVMILMAKVRNCCSCMGTMRR